MVALQFFGRGFGRERVGRLLAGVSGVSPAARGSRRLGVGRDSAGGVYPELALAQFARSPAVFASFSGQGFPPGFVVPLWHNND